MRPPVWCQSGSPGLRAVCPVAWAHALGSVTWSSFQMTAQCARCPRRRLKTVWSMRNAVSFLASFQLIQMRKCNYLCGITEPWLSLWGLSSQQLPGYRVGWMGCLQCHLWSWHEKERAHGEDAPSRWLHLWSRSARSGEVHDARMPWVAAYSWPQHFQHVRSTD